MLLEDLLARYSDEAVKFALLSTNYKNDVNITDALFPEAEAHLIRFYTAIAEAEEKFPQEQGKEGEIDERFNEAMSDDFNTALALSDLFGYFKEVKRLTDAGDPRPSAPPCGRTQSCARGKELGEVGRIARADRRARLRGKRRQRGLRAYQNRLTNGKSESTIYKDFMREMRK